MPEKELRAKYGGKLPKAINRAIRAEIEGGGAVLDQLTGLAGPAMQSGWKKRDGTPTPEAVLYHKHEKKVQELEAQIRAKYKIPPAQPAKAAKPARLRRHGTPRSGKITAEKAAAIRQSRPTKKRPTPDAERGDRAPRVKRPPG